MATDSGGSTKPVAVIILGADALLATRPATPIQLWHACVAAGYDLAVPATWGDELVAGECLRAIGTHPETVTVMCSCPVVARAIGDGETDLSAHLISLVAPPVATARYLRRVYGDRRVHITYVGLCPAAGDSAIDAWLTPPELLARFAANAIDLARQPQLFESVLPPDRRRHLSQPGGMPTAERAAALPRPRQVVEIDDADVTASIRRHLMSGVRTLVDIAPRLGCACSGATPGASSAEARLAVTTLEPPRSQRPVIVDPIGLALLRRVPPRLRPDADVRRPEERSTPSRGTRPDAPGDVERTVATSRPAARSPLSWNLRERALPQPPTSARPRDPLHRGQSSATWSAFEAAPPGGGPDRAGQPPSELASDAGVVDLDLATAAAVRALETAAKEFRDVDAARAAEASGKRGDESDAHTATLGTASVEASVAIRDELASAPAEQNESGNESVPRRPRATPPGGYWFVGVAVAGASDNEVERDPPTVEHGGSQVESTDTSTDKGEDVVAELEALFTQSPAAPNDEDAQAATNLPPPDAAVGNESGSAAAASEDLPTGVPETDSVTPPDAGAIEAPPPDRDRPGEPPDKLWVVAMTIILLIAGALVARDIAHRRAVEPRMTDGPVAGRVESVAAGSLDMLPDVASGRSATIAAEAARDVAGLDSVGRVVSSLFVAPGASPAGRPPSRPAPPPRAR